MTSASPARRGPGLRLTVTAHLLGMNIVLSVSVFSLPAPGGRLYFCGPVIRTAAILFDPLSAFIMGGVRSFPGSFFLCRADVRLPGDPRPAGGDRPARPMRLRAALTRLTRKP